MLVHFILFGNRLSLNAIFDKLSFAMAGLAVYLVFTLLKNVAWGGLLNFWMAPLSLVLLLYLSGFYNIYLERK